MKSIRGYKIDELLGVKVLVSEDGSVRPATDAEVIFARMIEVLEVQFDTAYELLKEAQSKFGIVPSNYEKAPNMQPVVRDDTTRFFGAHLTDDKRYVAEAIEKHADRAAMFMPDVEVVPVQFLKPFPQENEADHSDNCQCCQNFLRMEKRYDHLRGFPQDEEEFTHEIAPKVDAGNRTLNRCLECGNPTHREPEYSTCTPCVNAALDRLLNRKRTDASSEMLVVQSRLHEKDEPGIITKDWCAKMAALEPEDGEIAAGIPLEQREIRYNEQLVDDVEEYLHWRKVNPQIKGGENYLKRFRESLTSTKREIVGWQPIISAPQDEEIDLWAEGTRYENCHFHLDQWLRWDSYSTDKEPEWQVVNNPSHWMKVKPPVIEDGGGK